MIPVFQPLRRAILGLTVAGLGALAACQGSDAPVAPDLDAPSPTVTVHGVRLVTVQPGQGALFTAGATTAERVSAKDGATLTSDDASLAVTAGSIPDDTTITMKPENDGFVSFRFGPSGLQFDPAAVLTISAAKANLDGLDPSRLAIAGAGDDADDWQVIGGTYDPITDTVTVPILHFSRYALCVR